MDKLQRSQKRRGEVRAGLQVERAAHERHGHVEPVAVRVHERHVREVRGHERVLLAVHALAQAVRLPQQGSHTKHTHCAGTDRQQTLLTPTPAAYKQ